MALYSSKRLSERICSWYHAKCFVCSFQLISLATKVYILKKDSETFFLTVICNLVPEGFMGFTWGKEGSFGWQVQLGKSLE